MSDENISASGAERRVDPRKILHTRALIRIDGKVFQGHTLDVSASGLAVVVADNMPTKITLDVEFGIPLSTQGLILVRAKARIMNSILSDRDGGFRIGLNFIEIDAASSAAISKYFK